MSMFNTATAIVRRAIAGKAGPLYSAKRIIETLLPNERIKVAFDVGANTGQSVEALSAAFAGCKIYSFEPDPDTFLSLRQFVTNRRLAAQCFNFALGSADGKVHFDNRVKDDMRRIATNQNSPEDLPLVEIRTFDQVFDTLALESVDYLKIDTEGHDLEVLRGASRSLGLRKINIIETECGMNCDNRDHVPFCTIQSYLEGLEYRAFYIFEQVSEWPSQSPHLRRVNALFISPDVIERNRGGARH